MSSIPSKTVLLLVLATCLSLTLAFAADKPQTFTGKVSDAMCGAEHMMGGDAERRWTSLAPAERTKRTIFWLVVPRTTESSITTTRFPFKTALCGFNLIFTPKLRID